MLTINSLMRMPVYNGLLRREVVMGKTTSMAWIKGIAALLSDQGLDVPALFSEVGIAMTDMDDSDARCASEKISHLWELAVTR